MTSLSVTPSGAALGAEIEGPDLSVPLESDVVAQVRRALLDHGVVFFRDQQLSAHSLRRLAGYFGQPLIYPFVAGVPEVPEVVEVRKEADETVNFGGLWHTDTSYLETPPLGSILYAVEVPPSGGDTLFSCMSSAWRALSDETRQQIDGLQGINASNAAAAVTREARIEDNPGRQSDSTLQAIHPIVRTHPETGEKSLYCSAAHTIGIVDLPDDESTELLQMLYRHQQRDEFVYRFQWRAGSVAFWDNRCTQHNAMNDYHGHRRVMLRTTIEGDRPV